ncbi:hypothetical protein WN48_05243 [Eufriesea mexicana]|uniref:Uncharacterized protein n=1 Tax=Eufriesea mexicana TaxID=516756 RepID=A0A310SKF3_9HYME|nr:PREDICTED: uncharacterized protein LOC108555898 isoform X2 [Eufriesea mexicana]OAD60681.1 hypothetical protein WN48_05243 [Eufriesea mexicana]
MATIFESSFLSNRLYRVEERYEESANIFDKCDCTSYSYFVWSVILLVIGATITIFSLDDIVGDHTFFNLGRMWFIGPVLICSGLTIAVKCMLYLRRKSIIQMIFHQRQLFREPSGIRGTEGIDIQTPQRINIRIDIQNPQHIDIQSPPSYEAIAQETYNELPPPSYAEAVMLIRKILGRNTKPNSTTISCDSITTDRNDKCKP